MPHDGTLSGLSSCRHTHYKMTCGQFDQLLSRAGQCCEICGRPGVQTEHRQLYIDHESVLGDWAVRGLLCGKCNSRLRRGVAFSPEAQAFLDNAWHRQQADAVGLVGHSVPEPSRPFHDQFGRRWAKDRFGWNQPEGHGLARHRNLSWTRLVDELGPHNVATSLSVTS